MQILYKVSSLKNGTYYAIAEDPTEAQRIVEKFIKANGTRYGPEDFIEFTKIKIIADSVINVGFANGKTLIVPNVSTYN